jgi:hypothetical protein
LACSWWQKTWCASYNERNIIPFFPMENLMSIYKVSQFHNEDELLVKKAYFSYFSSPWCVGSSKKGTWVIMLLEIISCFMIRMKVPSLQLIQHEKNIISLYVVNKNKDKILVLRKFMFFKQRPFTHLVLSSCFLVAYR